MSQVSDCRSGCAAAVDDAHASNTSLTSGFTGNLVQAIVPEQASVLRCVSFPQRGVTAFGKGRRKSTGPVQSQGCWQRLAWESEAKCQTSALVGGCRDRDRHRDRKSGLRRIDGPPHLRTSTIPSEVLAALRIIPVTV